MPQITVEHIPYKIQGKCSLCAVLFSRCMLNTVDGPSDTVEDYLCDPEEMPLGARKCTLPCPEDCVMSEWGSWSQCSLVRSILKCHIYSFLYFKSICMMCFAKMLN